MQHYVEETGICRMRLLLDYFGEPMERDCGRCDACARRSQSYPAPDSAPAIASEPLANYERDIERERMLRDEYGDAQP